MGIQVDFGLITKTVPFHVFFDHYNIPYRMEDKRLVGDNFIVIRETNLFCRTGSKKWGSTINFLSELKNISLRDAGIEIKTTFMQEPEAPKRDIPVLKLEYHKKLEELAISKETAELYGVGFCNKGIFAGYIAFYMGEHYIGYRPRDGDWKFPKGFRFDCLFNAHDHQATILTADPFLALMLLEQGENACALGRQTMTAEQEKLIKAKYTHIKVIHPQPEAIVLRLVNVCYVTAQKG